MKNSIKTYYILKTADETRLWVGSFRLKISNLKLPCSRLILAGPDWSLLNKRCKFFQHFRCTTHILNLSFKYFRIKECMFKVKKKHVDSLRLHKSDTFVPSSEWSFSHENFIFKKFSFEFEFQHMQKMNNNSCLFYSYTC